MPEHGEHQEREQHLKEVFESLLLGRQDERAEQQEDGPEYIKDRFSHFPERLQNKLTAEIQELEKDGIKNPTLLAKYADKKAITAEQNYFDKRFQFDAKGKERMLTMGYAQEEAVLALKEILGNSPKMEDLKKVALLNFDANGLKAVNDLSGLHEMGTEYLKRIAEVFYAKDSPEAKRLKELGIDDILPATPGGGDEFSVLLKSEKPIPQEAIEEALKMYEAAIQRLDVGDLVDFRKDETILNYLGISKERAADMKEEERAVLIEEARKEIPPGFKMRSSAAGGGATLYEGMLAAVENDTKPLTKEDTFNIAINKIRGGMWDAADQAATQNKLSYKESLRAAEADPGDKFYSKVLARTTEARVMEARMNDLTMEIKKIQTMESEQAELDDLMDKGLMDEAAYGKNMRELRKKYRTTA